MSTEELRKAISNKHPYISRITDNIPQAGEWFADKWEVVSIVQGKIIMRKKTEDALLCWKIINDEEFKKKIFGEPGYNTTDLYKGKMP